MSAETLPSGGFTSDDVGVSGTTPGVVGILETVGVVAGGVLDSPGLLGSVAV
jgi:hypothetical protein